jgi:hypothetical protein
LEGCLQIQPWRSQIRRLDFPSTLRRLEMKIMARPSFWSLLLGVRFFWSNTNPAASGLLLTSISIIHCSVSTVLQNNILSGPRAWSARISATWKILSPARVRNSSSSTIYSFGFWKWWLWACRSFHPGAPIS